MGRRRLDTADSRIGSPTPRIVPGAAAHRARPRQLCLSSLSAVDSRSMSRLFSRRPCFIGVVHLAPTPGAPRFEGSFENVVRRAVEDARALRSGGCDALIVENFGDAPFFPRRVPAETVASLALCVSAVSEAAEGLPVGVNVLRNDARSALAIAAVTRAEFVRINVHTRACVTDQGILQGGAHETLRERARLAPGVALLCDSHVKHGRSLGDEALSEAVSDLVRRGLADAVIVTGRATGMPPLGSALEEAREAAAGVPILIGSGLDDRNAAALLPLADGAIVGTFLKRDGRVENPVDAQRVERIARIMEGLARDRGRS
jgi:membrane complex biogenesis BtpA family protein